MKNLISLVVSILLLNFSVPSHAQDRTSYADGSRPKILINWQSFEDSGFPASWKTPFTNVVINGYTRVTRVAGIDVRPQFYGYITDGRTSSNSGEIVISANTAHARSYRLASTFGSFPDRLIIVFHRNAGATMSPWNFTPFHPQSGEVGMMGVFMHELGHALGLDHSPNGKGIMGGTYGFTDNFGPWAGDISDLRSLYSVRDDNRIRGLKSTDSGLSWNDTNSDITRSGNSNARTTHELTVAADLDSNFFNLAWTTPNNRLTWFKTDGRSVENWTIFGGGPEAMFGSAMASGAGANMLWAYVDEDSDLRRIRVLKSTDDGRTWGYTSFPNYRTYGRPGLAYTRVNGRSAWVVVWANYDESDTAKTGKLYGSISTNNGATWTSPQSLNDLYHVLDGVQIACDLDNSCLLGISWAGKSDGFAYGQNRLRFSRISLNESGTAFGPASWCFPNHFSRVAPGIAFNRNSNQFTVGFRGQNFNTTQHTAKASIGGCPSDYRNISGSTTHVAPSLSHSRSRNETHMWSARE